METMEEYFIQVLQCPSLFVYIFFFLLYFMVTSSRSRCRCRKSEAREISAYSKWIKTIDAIFKYTSIFKLNPGQSS